MRFTASLETFDDMSCLGWVHELPGCAVRVPHRTEIERSLAAGIRRFLAEAGEPVPERIELAVAAETGADGAGGEATAALIEPDLTPLDPATWASVAHRLALSRARLLARLDAVDPGHAGWADLRDELRHVGLIELLLVAQTFEPDTPDGLRAYLDWTRHVAMARMAEVAASDAGSVVVTGGSPGDGEAEAWTASKVARRLLWHERLHLPPA